ncbi:HNH endonuclease [Phyllobacterium salinisoli]|uniref:HNH endonuclease n=2 Tax=Phyllobacterium salinisoli TaxID=1899321 RepID=A0A368K9B7_9HYPH|nr:HNH endonuclease signature motif containing protein [Phyllobacterium salinisoli]RCS25946.1 HNH endonuclease [Phyllobacterium salinisoli]
MPSRAPRICGCGHRIAPGVACPCEERRARERKARHDQRRPTARQRGYTAEWERESKAFLAANPACRRCGVPAALVDHIQPHKGNQRLFWNRSNWQPLCRPCHSGAKQAQERREETKTHDC